MIEIRQIEKSYNELEVLRDISLKVEAGQKIALIGPSGSGKSTLLRLMNGLESPNSGQILFEGKDIFESKFSLSRHRQDVGMIFQQFNLFDHLNVLANCNIGQEKVLKLSKKEATEVSMKFLEKVGMKDFAHSNVNMLSGGQKQRVAIARALAMNPKVLLFDEPTSALDPQMVEEVLKVIEDLAASGLTMVIVTHEMQFAFDVADTIYFMKDGVIVEHNSPQELLTNPRQESTKAFLSKFIK